MEVLDFMNTHSNWEDILTQPPYSITVKRDGDYILLKYNQLCSNFSLQIVRESRGAIFYQEPDGKYICVCRAFDKFFNCGEANCAEIDWNSAVTEEKVDGSLMRLWCHNNQWHLSTNGTIDAFKAQIGDVEKTFGDLFNEALLYVDDSYPIEWTLDPDYIYIFELVSPESRVTISYPETKLYYLGQRNMTTMEESKEYTESMKSFGILAPKVYPLTTLEECLSYVKDMTKDQEGFVIRDKYFNRMKLKSPEYLLAFHMNNNGVVTTKRIIDMIKNEQVDDFLAYCPEYSDHVNRVISAISDLEFKLKMEWFYVDKYAECSRKEFAAQVNNSQYKDFLFRKYDNHNLGVYDYIMSNSTSKIKKMIEME